MHLMHRETVSHDSFCLRKYMSLKLVMLHVVETCFFSSSRALSFLINDPKLRRSSSHTLRSSYRHGHSKTKDITRRRCVTVKLFPEYRVSLKSIHPYPERLKKTMFIRGMRHGLGIGMSTPYPRRARTGPNRFDVYHTIVLWRWSLRSGICLPRAAFSIMYM